MAGTAQHPEPHRAWRIANARGVPATIGCLARAHDTRTVLLSTWHALFGEGSTWNDIVWLVDEGDPRPSYRPIGRTLEGKVGTVRFKGDDYFVDCAIASCGLLNEVAAGVPSIAGCDTADRGSTVTKIGAATGVTTGVVVEDAYCGSVIVGVRTVSAPRQIVVRTVDSARPFSAEGDSGALIVNSMNRAVGLLWGTTSRGDGVACHIAPVLHALSVTLSTADL